MQLSSRLGFVLVTALALAACGVASEEVDTASHSVEMNEAPDATDPPESTEPSPEPTHLRIIAGNLTSGNKQSWDPGHGVRMLKGLAADVAVLQEFNYGRNTEEDYREFLANAFDSSFYYSVERSVQIPNGVVSRYPIVDHGAWADPQVGNRSFAWARIDVPGDKDLWAVSLHLLTSGSGNRQAEASALVRKIRDVVPESDYLVIGGDFNTGSRSETCLRTLGQLTRTSGPWPADSRNNGNSNRNRSKPYDWLIADPDLDVLEIPLVIGNRTFTNGLVFDSREFPELDSVAPAQRGDSSAMNMQHMAIVRDFVLPN